MFIGSQLLPAFFNSFLPIQNACKLVQCKKLQYPTTTSTWWSRGSTTLLRWRGSSWVLVLFPPSLRSFGNIPISSWVFLLLLRFMLGILQWSIVSSQSKTILLCNCSTAFPRPRLPICMWFREQRKCWHHCSLHNNFVLESLVSSRSFLVHL